MSDVAWRKFIIKVKCEQSSGLDRKSGSNTTVFYFCRTCPSFRTSAKECADVHLSKVHLVDSGILRVREFGTSSNPCSVENCVQNCQPTISSPNYEADSFLRNSPLEARSSSLSSVSVDYSPPASPTAPSSPSSPISKEALRSTRKRITINLNASAGFPKEIATNDTSCDVPRYSDIKSDSRSVYCCTECYLHFDHFDAFRSHQLKHGTIIQRDQKQTSTHNSDSDAIFDLSQPEEINRLQFLCTQCNRAFGSKQACKIHARKHSTKKQLKCRFCSSRFSLGTSLKRHLMEIHSTVPSQYGDNMENKEFGINEDPYSDSDGSTNGKPLHQSQSRKCRINRNLNSCSKYPTSRPRRGRPRRSSEWLLKTLEDELKRSRRVASSSALPHPVGVPTEGVCLDSRYRMILPRPSSGVAASQPRPLAIARSGRSRRSRSSRNLAEFEFQKEIFSPLLRDTLARESRPLTIQQQQQQCSFVLDSTVSIPDSLRVDLPVVETLGLGQIDTGKSPHVLTVAAAYASQLPSSTCHTLTLTTLSEGTICPKASTSDAVPTTTSASSDVAPAIQVYASSWPDSSVQQTNPQGVKLDVPGSTLAKDIEPVSLDSLTLAPRLPSLPTVQYTQSHFQLYPVLDPDNQTTLYYISAAPVELSETGASLDNCYNSFCNPQLLWLSDSISTGADHHQLPDTPTASSVAFLNALGPSFREGTESTSPRPPTGNVISVLPGANDTIYVAYNGGSAILDHLGEPAEVVDLNSLVYRADDSSDIVTQPTYYDISPPASVCSKDNEQETSSEPNPVQHGSVHVDINSLVGPCDKSGEPEDDESSRTTTAVHPEDGFVPSADSVTQ